MASQHIRAAGGVVWRRVGGPLEVAVVHRPRYDDWSLPKGKVIAEETKLEAAVREVGEELGAAVTVSRRIGQFRYEAEGVPKRVTYWVMRFHGGEFVPNDEVDEVRWLQVRDARAVLSYDVDRSVLADFAALPVPDSVIVLVRHAKAGKRNDWPGEDALRPLDEAGKAQAARLATLLAFFGPERVYAAEPVRCVSTVQPLAAALDLEVRVDPVFNDETYADAPWATQTALLALAKPGKVSVVCSQGDTIPGLIDRLGPGISSSETRKGAWWVLNLVDGDVVSADHYDAP
jgi:8-oxo-dGTP pyrophosphatase MutT (NUDIX family)/phosphohistidine phosphatase SixA